MRKAAVGGVFAALLLGLSMAAAAPKDDDEDDLPKSSAKQGSSLSSFRRWLGASDKSTDKKPAAPASVGRISNPSHKKPEAAPEKGKTPSAPKKASPAVELEREQKALDRRQAVVLKLQEIALETNDVELQRMADQLDERVWALYMQRTAHLPGSRTIFESDEKVLDKHLNPDAISGRPGPLQPQAGAGKDRGSRAAVGEEK